MALQAGLEENINYWNACANQGIKQSCTALQFHAAFEILNECIRFWSQFSKGKNKPVSQYVISGSVFNSFNNFGIEMIAHFLDHFFLSKCFHHNLPTKESLGGFHWVQNCFWNYFSLQFWIFWVSCLFNFSMVFFNFSIVFFNCSMVFFKFSMVFFNFSMVFHGFLQVFHGFRQFFHGFLQCFPGFLQVFYGFLQSINQYMYVCMYVCMLGRYVCMYACMYMQGVV